MDYPYSLNDYCLELISFIRENNIKNPCVVAHSFGARIAVKVLSQNPNIFSKLVITGGAGLKPRFNLIKFFKKLFFKVIKHFLPPQRLQKYYSSDYKKLSPIMKQSFLKIVNEPTDNYAKKITIPTLIICGEFDRETPHYMSKRFNKLIKNSKLVEIKGAGHFAFIDRPMKFNTEVREFLL